ncbi:GntR family transcriptional regulator [Ramlibacter sp.]|uniref:GntR family transcriptional regulator n=1 Tax=Ramlibacter sp. TaxID=1917967 RepID=UPI003D09D9D4
MTSHVSRRAQAPLYATLARHLAQAIEDGTYPVGSLLPTEIALSEQHGMSRQTVREALRQLTTQGLLLRQPGVGTRVQQRTSPVRYTHSVNSFADLEQYARELRLVIQQVDDVTVSGELAALIGCRESSKWLRVRGVRCPAGSDDPAAVSETYIRDGFPGIRRHLADLHATAIHVLLEREYGEVIEEIRQQIHAIAIDAAEAAILRVPAGSPGLQIRRSFFAAGGRLILAGHVTHPGAQYHYGTRFMREHSPGA